MRYRGALPDLFREGHSVVAEGFVKPMSQYPGIPPNSPDMHTSLTEKAKESGCYFAAIEVLAKHDEVVCFQFWVLWINVPKLCGYLFVVFMLCSYCPEHVYNIWF